MITSLEPTAQAASQVTRTPLAALCALLDRICTENYERADGASLWLLPVIV